MRFWYSHFSFDPHREKCRLGQSTKMLVNIKYKEKNKCVNWNESECNLFCCFLLRHISLRCYSFISFCLSFSFRNHIFLMAKESIDGWTNWFDAVLLQPQLRHNHMPRGNMLSQRDCFARSDDRKRFFPFLLISS